MISSKIKHLIFFLTFWGVCLQSHAQGQDPLEVGIAVRNITPDQQVKNWVTGKAYTDIKDSLFVRALVMRVKEQTCVIIGWDLVDAGESATAEIRRRITRSLGIPSENIMVNASHNHSAPWAPVYSEDYRGKEADTWWAIRYMPAQNDDPYFRAWMDRLMEESLAAVSAAVNTLQVVEPWISRVDISQYVHNRRPRPAAWGIEESPEIEGYNYRHPDWDPTILGGGWNFGPVDRAMTILYFRDLDGNSVANVFHMSAHAVSIYPYSNAVSADWPGQTIKMMNQEIGGTSMFLQGTAGNINPWRRDTAAVNEMSLGLSSKALKSGSHAARMSTSALMVDHRIVGLPLTEQGIKNTGQEMVQAEVQAIVLGPLAIVTLPGEPMTELGMAIRKSSPFPQTLVLGYSNGNGVHYVGMPGEKVHGGYEVGARSNVGRDNAGLLLVDTAIELLHDMFEKK